MCLIQTDLVNIRQSDELMIALCFPLIWPQQPQSEQSRDSHRWVAILFAILDPGMGEYDQLDWESCVCLLHCLRVSLLK